MTSRHNLQFFVYVVESPSPEDFYAGRQESEMLLRAVALNQVPCHVRTVTDQTSFVRALGEGLVDAMSRNPGRMPIVHISAHGSSEGVGLTSGEFLDWSLLRQLLVNVNKALNDSLIVCMSTCEGYSGIRMAMQSIGMDNPYLALVGCNGKPTWAESAIGFAVLYHLCAAGVYVKDAVEVMRAASGNGNFFSETAEKAKRDYLDYMKTVDVNEAQQELAQLAVDEPPTAQIERHEAEKRAHPVSGDVTAPTRD